MKREGDNNDDARKNERRLTDLQVGNFKAFADTQHVPIKPLTLIFGANSSGKSSIIHSLLLANHALAKGDVDVQQPDLAGQSVDLGGFGEFVHHHEVERGCIFEFSFRPQQYYLKRMTLRFEIGKAIYTESGKEPTGPVGVSSFEVKLGDQNFLRIERNLNGKLRIVDIDLDHPFCNRFFAKVREAGQSQPAYGQSQLNVGAVALKEIYASQPSAEVSTKMGETGARDSNLSVDSYRRLQTELKSAASRMSLSSSTFPPISERHYVHRSEYENSPDEWWDEVRNLPDPEFRTKIAELFIFEMEGWLDWIKAEFRQCLESLTYLGPLRCYPSRHLTGMQDQDPNWFSGGGNAWKRLRDEPGIVKKVNEWLGSLQGPGARYELRVRNRNLRDLATVGSAEKERLAHQLRQAKIQTETDALAAVEALLADLAGDPRTKASCEVILADKQTGLEVSHRDVGVGISQILPVLVHAYADRNQLVAIEQPEIHLHPALQAELGDVFIESALGERRNTFVLETHSEHLILRIMRRMRETFQKKELREGLPHVHPNDVAILFVERDGSRSIVREMPLNEMGQLVKAWPGGFFEEGFREVFA